LATCIYKEAAYSTLLLSQVKIICDYDSMDEGDAKTMIEDLDDDSAIISPMKFSGGTVNIT
jgi:hypothetical protein